MRVAVDLEDVLVGCNTKFIERLNSFITEELPQSNLKFYRSDISGWGYDGVREPFSELIAWEEDLISKFMYGHGDWEGYIPITEKIWQKETEGIPWIDENLEKNLQILQETIEKRDGDLHLVTARRRVRDSIKKKKLRERNLEEFFDKIVIESEKHKLEYDFYIDDNPNLFPKLGGGRVQLVRDQPWNRNNRIEKPHMKVETIEESAEMIKNVGAEV